MSIFAKNIHVMVMLDSGAFEPTRAHESDAGLDLRAVEDAVIMPGDAYVFDTGVHMAIRRGWFGKIESKSGLMTKRRIVCPGGVIDSGYTGSIKVMVENRGDRPYMVERGNKIAQIVICKCDTCDVKIVSDLGETERGDNGFGSSGK